MSVSVFKIAGLTILAIGTMALAVLFLPWLAAAALDRTCAP